MGNCTASGPVTGGCFIFVGKDCPLQKLRIDYEINNTSDPMKHQIFFLSCTGKDGSFFWVVNHSQFLLQSTGGVLNDLF